MDQCRPYSRRFVVRHSATFHGSQCVRHNVHTQHIGRNTDDNICDNHCICDEYGYSSSESHKHVGLFSTTFYFNVEAQSCTHFHPNHCACALPVTHSHRHRHVHPNSNSHFYRDCHRYINRFGYTFADIDSYRHCHIHANFNTHSHSHQYA